MNMGTDSKLMAKVYREYVTFSFMSSTKNYKEKQPE